MENYLKVNPADPTQRSNYLLTSFASNFEDLTHKTVKQKILLERDTKPLIKELDKKKDNLRKFFDLLSLSNPIEWMFILFFSIIITLYILILDSIITLGIYKRNIYTNTSYPIINFILYVLSSIIFFLIATSVGYFISPDSDGSGIPEMKTVLSGVPIYKYFAFNAFVGKSFGLFCALVGGASVGRVGPYVHLSCALCYNLLKIDYFNSIYKNVSSRSNMLSIACATGITLALGTPLGGVLFSIESTSSIYITSNIWKSFFSTIISIFIVRFFKKPINLVPISIEEVESKTTPTFLLINFALVGIISGAIGALCSTLVAKGTYIRKRTKYQCLNNRFLYASIVAIITSVIEYFCTSLKKSDRTIMNFCFSLKDSKMPFIDHPNEGIHLLLTFLFKYLLTVLCLVCTMPAV